MHTIMRITTSTEATPGAGRHSLPITPTQSVETPQGIQKKGCRKSLARIRHRPQKLLPRLHSRKVPLNKRNTR